MCCFAPYGKPTPSLIYSFVNSPSASTIREAGKSERRGRQLVNAAHKSLSETREQIGGLLWVCGNPVPPQVSSQAEAGDEALKLL